MLKLKLLKFELLQKTQRLHVNLFLLKKPKQLLLMLTLLPLPNFKKKDRRDTTLFAWLGGMTERRRTLAVMSAITRSTWSDHRLPAIRSRKPAR